jgi:hypothetical protein
MKNERGSIPIAVIIVFTLGIAVLALTQLLLSEKMTAKSASEKQLEKFYEEDKIIEIVNNLLIQKTMSKEWEDEIGEETFIDMNDLIQIEDMVNKTILPSENSKKQIITSDLHAERVDTYCEELYEDSLVPEEDPYFIGFNCAHVPTDVEFTLTITEGTYSDSFRLIFEDIYPTVTRLGDAIVLDKSEMITDIGFN